ncbi:MAG: hypothetical protein MUF52_10870 [Syntrophobacteraceae bacterium]|nr:hypothetical protein [Syntrophobacteraceae bacterium]
MICPKCEREQPDDSQECLKCGVIFSKIQDSVTSNQMDPPSSNPFRIGLFYATICLFVMALYAGAHSLGSLAVTPDYPKVSWVEKDASLEAFIMMENFVKERLKAPANADFKRGYSDSVTRIERQKYRVISWVDAENSFGAKIRNHFIGVIEQIENDRWSLISLEFANN